MHPLLAQPVGALAHDLEAEGLGRLGHVRRVVVLAARLLEDAIDK